MSHHEHRHHVKRPEGPKSDNSLFWLLMLFLMALVGLGFALSRPPLPPHTEAANHSCILSERGLECGKDMAPRPEVRDVLPPEERTADPTPAPEPGIEPAPEPVAESAADPEPVKVFRPGIPFHRHHAKPARHKPRAEPRHHIRHYRPAATHHAAEPAPPDNIPSWDDPSKYPYIPGEMRP
jgi:hypothetical protein